MYKARIAHEVHIMTKGATPGSRMALAAHPGAVTRVLTKLTKEELKEVEKTQLDWRTNGPSPAIKAQYVPFKFLWLTFLISGQFVDTR